MERGYNPLKHDVLSTRQVRRAAALLYVSVFIDVVDIILHFVATTCFAYAPLWPLLLALLGAGAAALLRSSRKVGTMLAAAVFIMHFLDVRERFIPFGPAELLAVTSIAIRFVALIILLRLTVASGRAKSNRITPA